MEQTQRQIYWRAFQTVEKRRGDKSKLGSFEFVVEKFHLSNICCNFVAFCEQVGRSNEVFIITAVRMRISPVISKHGPVKKVDYIQRPDEHDMFLYSAT